MKILIVLQSSVEPLYQKETQLLKDIYGNLIRKNNLPVDVISYVGDAEKTMLVDDTLYIKCDNKYSIEKHRQLYKYIHEHPEYDIIIKTNVSTVLNLDLICKYVCSVDFYSHNMYSCASMWDDRCTGIIVKDGKELNYGNFPIGFLHLAHRKVWEDIYNSYDVVIDKVISDIQSKIENNTYIWEGFPGDEKTGFIDVNDDLVMGALLLYTGHNTLQIANYIRVSHDEFDEYVLSHPDDNPDNVFSTICARCKLAYSDPKVREYYEPMVMQLIAILYGNHETSQGDIKQFLNTLKYRFL